MDREKRIWHAHVPGQKAGPYSFSELVAKLNAGEIQRKTLVWHTGMTGWVPLKDVPEFASELSRSRYLRLALVSFVFLLVCGVLAVSYHHFMGSTSSTKAPSSIEELKRKGDSEQLEKLRALFVSVDELHKIYETELAKPDAPVQIKQASWQEFGKKFLPALEVARGNLKAQTQGKGVQFHPEIYEKLLNAVAGLRVLYRAQEEVASGKETVTFPLNAISDVYELESVHQQVAEMDGSLAPGEVYNFPAVPQGGAPSR